MIARCDAICSTEGGQDHLQLSVSHLLWSRASTWGLTSKDLSPWFYLFIFFIWLRRPLRIQPPSILTSFFSGPTAATKLQVWINASASQSLVSGFEFGNAPTVDSNWGVVFSFKIRTVQKTQIHNIWYGDKKKTDTFFHRRLTHQSWPLEWSLWCVLSTCTQPHQQQFDTGSKGDKGLSCSQAKNFF